MKIKRYIQNGKSKKKPTTKCEKRKNPHTQIQIKYIIMIDANR